jgi:hypothetical protein
MGARSVTGPLLASLGASEVLVAVHKARDHERAPNISGDLRRLGAVRSFGAARVRLPDMRPLFRAVPCTHGKYVGEITEVDATQGPARAGVP